MASMKQSAPMLHAISSVFFSLRSVVAVASASLLACVVVFLASGSDASGTVELATRNFPSPDSPQMNHDAPASYIVDCMTDVGDFSIAVTSDWAPQGAKRFYNLVLNQWYDQNYFFRVVKGFVDQWGLCGIPDVDERYQTANIPDDPQGKKSNTRGLVTFATAGPNTRTTQLFVNLGDNHFLDRQGFTPFGVIDDKGMAVIDKINGQYKELPDQNKIVTEGNAYLSKNFPNLSYLKQCRIRA